MKKTTLQPPVTDESGNRMNEVADSLPISGRDLPPLIREVVQNAPQSRKLAAFIACLSPLCALATRIRLKYFYDSRPSALLLQVIIEGNQSTGKSFAADIERLIMDSTIKEHDQEQRNMERDYRDLRLRRNVNERLDEEPKTTIRVIPATISKTVLVKRADRYQRILSSPLTFWMFAEELAQVTDAGKQGYSNLRTIMRSAYDYGSMFGMDFASDNSYSAIVDINICSMFCTTPAVLDEYMNKKAIEGGNITRCILCQLHDDLGADGALFKPYTPEQQEVIDRTLKTIMDDTYTSEGKLQDEQFLDMGWIDFNVRNWCRQRGHEATLSGSMALDVFRKRSSVSAFRTAALCYYLYRIGQMPEMKARKLCKRIYLFMADYILRSLIKRWGKAFEELNAKRMTGNSTGRDPGIFAMLGDEFSREELKNLVKEQGKTTPARMFIYMWTRQGDITVIDNDHFRKTEKHRNHDQQL